MTFKDSLPWPYLQAHTLPSCSLVLQPATINESISRLLTQQLNHAHSIIKPYLSNNRFSFWVPRLFSSDGRKAEYNLWLVWRTSHQNKSLNFWTGMCISHFWFDFSKQPFIWFHFFFSKWSDYTNKKSVNSYRLIGRHSQLERFFHIIANTRTNITAVGPQQHHQ